MFKGKKVLVTGSEGLIGRELVELLRNEGATIVLADLKLGQDLRNFETCLYLCENVDYVFHLMGVKGSARMTKSSPVDFMAPMLQCDTNMIIAAQQKNVKGFLYTSSIALLNMNTDRFPATAKQTAETLIEAMQVQYPDGTKYCIVRPASVYGRYENFDRDGLMVLSDLIKQATNNEDLELWDDGEGLRDFINSRDVARAMILTMKKMPPKWIAIGCGDGYKIKDMAKIIAEEAGVKLKLGTKSGKNDIRTMEIPELKEWGFELKTSMEEGLKEVINVRNNRNSSS